MAEQHDPTWRTPARRVAADEAGDDTISLKPLVETLTIYRRVIGLSIVSAIAATTVLLLAIALLLPTERTSSVEFRLLFKGAAENKYPNDSSFSAAEIVETSVLSEVFQQNDLQRFGPYEDFKNSFAVLSSSHEGEILDRDYAARLADSKLSPIERSRLEEEYRKKREAIRDPVFQLSMRRMERIKTLPPDLAEKVLNDILAVWARQAVEQKGALRFKVEVLSRNLLTQAVMDQDFLLAADSLRTQTVRLLRMAGELSELPGAATVRSPKDNVSIAEVKASLEDIQRYQIHPLLNIIRSEGVAKDPQAISRFVSSQVAQVGIARDVTKKKIQSLQSALQVYMSRGAQSADAAAAGNIGRTGATSERAGVAPQLSESFLDRLIEMSAPTQASEVTYRQKLTNEIIDQNSALSDLEESLAFYEDLDRSLKSVARTGASTARIEEVNHRLKEAFDSVGASLDKLTGLFVEMSRVSLNSTSLYVVTRPFKTDTTHAVSPVFAGKAIALSGLLALVVAPLACLVHRTRRRPPAPVSR